MSLSKAKTELFAATMKSGDDSGEDLLAEVLRGCGVGGGSRYWLLRRNGRVLLALPSDRETATKTLQLYQPQKAKAKLVGWGVKKAASLGLHRFVLPSYVVENAIANQEMIPNLVGVMVGSTGHLCDRAVYVTRRDGAWEVAKFARGQSAGNILSNEASMLRLLEGNGRVPELIALETTAVGEILRMKWMSGRSWQGNSIQPILEILDEWRVPGEWRRLGALPEWQWIEKGLVMAKSEPAILGLLRNRLVPVSIRHGDLTRPNLRLRTDGTLVVHDWERGAPEGAAGLDLAQFATQDVLFRNTLRHEVALTRIRESLSASPVQEWLSCNGWQRQSDLLLAANFALNIGAGYLNQQALLRLLLRTAGFDL